MKMRSASARGWLRLRAAVFLLALSASGVSAQEGALATTAGEKARPAAASGNSPSSDSTAAPKQRSPQAELLAHAPPPSAAACRGELRLSGTLYNDRHPENSFAMLGSAGQRAALYRAGAHIGEIELIAVRPRAVLFQDDAGNMCWIRMTHPAPAPAPAQAPQPPRRRAHK